MTRLRNQLAVPGRVDDQKLAVRRAHAHARRVERDRLVALELERVEHERPLERHAALARSPPSATRPCRRAAGRARAAAVRAASTCRGRRARRCRPQAVRTSPRVTCSPRRAAARTRPRARGPSRVRRAPRPRRLELADDLVDRRRARGDRERDVASRRASGSACRSRAKYSSHTGMHSRCDVAPDVELGPGEQRMHAHVPARRRRRLVAGPTARSAARGRASVRPRRAGSCRAPCRGSPARRAGCRAACRRSRARRSGASGPASCARPRATRAAAWRRFPRRAGQAALM